MKPTRRERAREAWRRLRGGELTPRRAAASVAVGLAVGVMPVWGIHWLLVLAICLPLRLDAGIAYLAANVSLPFVAPFITFAEIAVGARILQGAWPTLSPDDVQALALTTVLRELVLGTLVVGVVASTTGAMLAYGLAALARRRATAAKS